MADDDEISDGDLDDILDSTRAPPAPRPCSPDRPSPAREDPSVFSACSSSTIASFSARS